MINSRILLSVASIAAAGALIIGATFAFFSDTATSSDNSFSTGILDLKIRDNNEGFSDAVTASTVANNMIPGGTPTESYVCFKNTGDYDIQEIILAMSATGDVGALAPWVNTTKVELGQVSPGDCGDFATGSLTDYTSLFVSRFDGEGGEPLNSVVSLKEELNDVDGTNRSEDDLLDGVGALLPADQNVLLKFRTTWQLSADAPNSAQGKSVTVNTTFVGNQNELP